ncbi:hypothetical protein I4U23_031389 [Adineta vaga]|nr:hypothetical protein I4U23_031389 [Adineta vaga]
MAYLQHNQYGIKDVGHSVNIPQNDTARLMYYLDCACNAVNYRDNDINRYRNYNNWAQLSNEDIRLLVVLCYTLSPDVFNNKVFFHSDALCGNSTNKFYEISQVRNHLVAVQSIVIAGRSCQVNKIMTYKMSWMQTYYINPMRNIAQRLNNQNQRQTSNSKSSSCVIS